MTKITTHEVECQACGSKQNVEIFESINVTNQPELKEKLFQGQLNIFTCDKCSHKAMVDIPVLYNDMQRKFSVQYYPSRWIFDDSFLNEFTKQGEPAWTRDGRVPEKVMGYLKWTHIVFSMDELIRYVMFRDRISEKWKQSS